MIRPIALRLTLASAVASALFVSMALTTGCGGQPVGRICDLGVMPGSNESVVASPSLDCVSRTCLKVPLDPMAQLPPSNRYPTSTNGLCTDRCNSDGDCERVPESPCQSGFTCGIPVVVGPFCCEKFCICKDYIVIPDGGVPTPAACDPNTATNSCCNLPGRSGNAQYPACP